MYSIFYIGRWHIKIKITFLDIESVNLVIQTILHERPWRSILYSGNKDLWDRSRGLLGLSWRIVWTVKFSLLKSRNAILILICHMEYNYAPTNLPLYTSFILVLYEVRFHNRFIKTDVPAPVCSLWSINGFPKHAYFIAIFGCKPLRLCPVHFLY